MDNFSYFNDVFGHSYGDTVLKMVSEVLKSSFNAVLPLCDIVRLHGDVFFVLVSNRSVMEVKPYAEAAKRKCNLKMVKKGGEERFISISCVLTDTTCCVCDYTALLGHCKDLMDELRATSQNQLKVELR